MNPSMQDFRPHAMSGRVKMGLTYPIRPMRFPANGIPQYPGLIQSPQTMQRDQYPSKNVIPGRGQAWPQPH